MQYLKSLLSITVQLQAIIVSADPVTIFWSDINYNLQHFQWKLFDTPELKQLILCSGSEVLSFDVIWKTVRKLLPWASSSADQYTRCLKF